MIGLGIVFAIIAASIWAWREYVRRQPTTHEHVHRPIVVADGTVDICDGCGELINR